MVQVEQAIMAPQVMMEAMKMEVHAQDLKGRATLEPSSQVVATTRNKFLTSTIHGHPWIPDHFQEGTTKEND